MKFGIIAGTYFESIPEPYTERSISTPYGDIVVQEKQLEGGKTVYFLKRHGVFYEHEPSRINYRANIYGMHKLEVTHLIGLSNVGACDYTFKLGSFCTLSDFLDFTKDRSTSFERKHRLSLHTPMDDVFDPELTDALENLISEEGHAYSGRAVYACTEGPRFETAAEVRMLRMLGAQVIGMTIVPEAPLARSIGLKYAGLGLITNYATGMIPEVRDENIKEMIEGHKAQALEICFSLIRNMRADA